ncbi:MAG: Ig-like domain-containing protein, partial [Mangrovicoccus sp.]
TPDLNCSGTDSFTYTISDGVNTDQATVNVTVTDLPDPTAYLGITVSLIDPTSQAYYGHSTNTVDYINEGDTGTQTVWFVVRRTVDLTGPVTATLNVITDFDAADFVAGLPSSITLPDGVAEAYIPVQIKGDYDIEGIEALYVELTGTNRSDVEVGTGSWSRLDVLNDDAASEVGIYSSLTSPDQDPSGANGDTQALEGDSGVTPVFFTVLRTGSLTGPVTVNLARSGTASAADATGVPSQVTLADGQSSATFQVNITGDLSPEPDDVLTVSITGTDRSSVTVHGVNNAVSHTILNDDALNLAPIAVDDNYVSPEDALLVINPLNNDSDPEGDALRIIGATQPANGAVSFDPLVPDELRFIPTANWFGTTSFTYTITDGTSFDTATVTVVVEPVDDAPDAVDDVFSLNEDTTLNGNVLANDSDPEGDAMSASLVTDVQNGNLVLNPDGSFSYTPHTGFIGSDSFTYRNTANGLSDDAVVNITVLPVPNLPPMPMDDTYSVLEDGVLTVSAMSGLLVNDSDPNGDSLTAMLRSGPAHGTLTLMPNGNFVYTPDADFAGSDSFTYWAVDPEGAQDWGTVTINVTPIPDLPIAVDDTTSTTTGTWVYIDVLANDFDPDGTPVTLNSVTNGTHGSATIINGQIRYTPNPAFVSGVDVFTYEILDQDGNPATAQVTVTVNKGQVDVLAGSTSSVLEGDSGFTTATYTIFRSAYLNNTVSVDWLLVGTGFDPLESHDVNGSLPLSGTVTFAPGQSVATGSIEILGDLIDENNETMRLTISNAQSDNGFAVDIGRAQHNTVVIDDDGDPNPDPGDPNDDPEVDRVPPPTPPAPPRDPGKEADVWGDPHLITFDAQHWDFHAVGEFVTSIGTALGDEFQVQMRFVPFSNNISSTGAIATVIDGHRVVVYIDSEVPDGSGVNLWIDGQPVIIDPYAGPVDVGQNGGQVWFDGIDTYVIILPTGEQIMTKVRDTYMNTCLFLTDAAHPDGSLTGLLGNADGVQDNDFLMPDGTDLGADPSHSVIYGAY